jgi:hypothetical protein
VFILVAAVFAVIVGLVVWFLKRSYKIYAERWAALAPLVGGAHKGSRMTGTYQGRPVHARIDAETSGTDETTRRTTYHFKVKLMGEPGGRDWKVVYGGEKFLGFGEKRWHVSTKDDTLKERLSGAGVVVALQAWGSYPAVTYKAKKGEFEYSERVGGMYDMPTPERFRQQLDLLTRFAEVNEQVNAA